MNIIRIFINILNLYKPMEFDELLITTGVDALVRLIREKGKIELDEASSLLNIPPETLQEWARVLEEEGIIKLEYRLTKVNLVWLKPTEEEIISEKESFREEKGGLEKEVDAFRGRTIEQGKEISDLRQSFSEFYSKAYPRIEKLEKAVSSGSAPSASALPAGQRRPEEVIADYSGRLERFGADIDSIRGALGGIRSDIESVGIERKAKDAADRMERMDSIRQEFSALEKEFSEVKKKSAGATPSEGAMPSSAEFRKKFDGIKKDVASVKAKSAQIREDMISLHESSEILKGVAESIMGSEEKVQGIQDELDSLNKQSDALLEKANAISEKVKESADISERLAGTITTAKGVLTRFPTQAKVMEELDKMKAIESNLLEKTDAMEGLLSATGGRAMSVKQLTDTTKKMETKVGEMRAEIEALESSLEDEKATYLAFQKIKERIVPSIEGYQKQISGMESEIGKIQIDAVKQKESLKQDSEKIQQMLKEPGTVEAMKVVGEIEVKRKELDEIKQTLDELSDTSDNLTKRITLLSQQAKLVEIRAGPAAPAGPAETENKKEEIRHQLELSEAEELEFRRKREELKNLIKKLWESG